MCLIPIVFNAFRFAWEMHVSLALIFKVDTGLLGRLAKCIGNAGNDSILERLLATRISNRSPTSRLSWPKQYKTLSEAIDAPARFLKGWYASMRNVLILGGAMLVSVGFSNSSGLAPGRARYRWTSSSKRSPSPSYGSIPRGG
jgi:hypothetical protein